MCILVSLTDYFRVLHTEYCTVDKHGTEVYYIAYGENSTEYLCMYGVQ